jgi:magnesium transporter
MANWEGGLSPRASPRLRAASEPDLAAMTDRYLELDAEIDAGVHVARSSPALDDGHPPQPSSSFSHYVEVEAGHIAHHPEAADEPEEAARRTQPFQQSGTRRPSPPALFIPSDAAASVASKGLSSPVVYSLASPSSPIPVPRPSVQTSNQVSSPAHGSAGLSISPGSPSSWLSSSHPFFDDADDAASAVPRRAPLGSASSRDGRHMPDSAGRNSAGFSTASALQMPQVALDDTRMDNSSSVLRGDGIDHDEDASSPVPTGQARDHLESLGEETSRNGYVDRRYNLKCIEIANDGSVCERLLSRAEILQEARATLPTYAPSPKEVGRWLENPKEKSPDLREFKAHYGLRPASKKAMQKALRNYLRNSLQPRDIRQVDPAFSAKPALWVRHSALVVSLEGVRAIILHDKMFLFDPSSPVAQTAATVIRQSVMTTTDMQEDPHLPFEFKALEGIFIIGILGLEQEFNGMKPVIDRHLRDLPNDLTTRMLEELRVNKQRLHQFLARAHSVRDILDKLLDEDEDMANMYLSEKHASPSQSRNVENHDEVEMLLEAYMQVIDELVNRADLLNNAIEDTEDLVMIHLDTLRNRLLSVDLALNIFGMAFAFGGCVSSVFGMNLLFPLDTPSKGNYSFLIVVLVIVGFAVVVPWVSLVALKKRGLFSIR